MAKRALAERRYRTAARLRAGSEIMGRGEGLDCLVGPRPVAMCVRSQLIKSQSGVGNNDLVSVVCWVDERGYTSFQLVGHQVVCHPCIAPREQCVTPSKNIPLQPFPETSSFALEFRPPCPLHLLQTHAVHPL